MYIPRPIVGRRSMVTVGEGTEDAPNLSAEGVTENTACCMEQYSDEC
jgi:hypothetical protein